MMFETYNCTAPFFPYYGNQSLDDLTKATAFECKLNNLTQEKLAEYRDTFLCKEALFHLFNNKLI